MTELEPEKVTTRTAERSSRLKNLKKLLQQNIYKDVQISAIQRLLVRLENKQNKVLDALRHLLVKLCIKLIFCLFSLQKMKLIVILL